MIVIWFLQLLKISFLPTWNQLDGGKATQGQGGKQGQAFFLVGSFTEDNFWINFRFQALRLQIFEASNGLHVCFLTCLIHSGGIVDERPR